MPEGQHRWHHAAADAARWAEHWWVQGALAAPGWARMAPAWAASAPSAGGAGAGMAVATLHPVGAAGR